MNAELRKRLLRCNADLANEALSSADAVWLACDLLVAGHDSPALRELAGESPDRVRYEDAARLFADVLADLGVRRLSEEQAAWVVGRETARRILSGEVSPADWPYDLWHLGVLWREDEVRAVTLVAASNPDAVAEDVRALASGFVEEADRRITGW